MPRIPTYDSPQVAPDALPPFRQQNLPVAEGLAAAGKALQAAGSAGMDAAVKKAEEQNYYELMEAVTKYSAALNNARTKIQSEYLGKSADMASDIAKREQEKAWDEVARGITNPKVREVFRVKSMQMNTSYFDSISRHQAAETLRYQDETYKAALEQIISSAAGDVTKAGQELENLKRTINSRAMLRRLDVNDPIVKGELLQATTRFHIGVLNSLLSGADPSLAEKYFKDHMDEIDGTKRDEIRNAIDQTDRSARLLSLTEQAMALGKSEIETLDWVRKNAPAKYAEQIVGMVKTRFQEKEAARNEEVRRVADPYLLKLGEARAARKPVSASVIAEIPKVVGRLDSVLAERIVQEMQSYNDSLRSSGKAGSASKEDSKQLAAARLLYDMITNPDKWKNADLDAILTPVIRAGKLPPSVLTQAATRQQQLQKPAEATQVLTIKQRLDRVLRNAKVNGEDFADLDDDERARIELEALAKVEELVAAKEKSTGKKASQDDINAAIDSVTTWYQKSGIFGYKPRRELNLENADRNFTVNTMDPALKAEIIRRLRSKGLQPTNENIFDAYQALQRRRNGTR